MKRQINVEYAIFLLKQCMQDALPNVIHNEFTADKTTIKTNCSVQTLTCGWIPNLNSYSNIFI